MRPLTDLQLPGVPPRPPRALDPNAPALADDSLFGLGLPIEECRAVAIPVPYDVTCSGQHGTVDGPRALLSASAQVDLLEPLCGDVYRHGVMALPEPADVRAASLALQPLAARAREGDRAAHAAIEAQGEELWRWLERATAALLDSGRLPLVLGGEHALSFGAVRAAAARHPGLGLLQLDAHADLRGAYEGWRTSHASVMARCLELDPLGRVVQVGLRDFCREELERAQAAGPRVRWFTDLELARRGAAGEPWNATCAEIVAALPDTIWISFDIDGLDPSLCPGTGTPVPGGLTWRDAAGLLGAVAAAGKSVVGIDLVEIGPGAWDGYVAAKLLYLLTGIALR